jgi:heme/copper-type cytochrome/quinol oxidase subunit 2
MDGLTIIFLLGIVMVLGIYFYIKYSEKKQKHNH